MIKKTTLNKPANTVTGRILLSHVFLFFFATAGFSQTVTTGSLIKEMVNLEKLAENPVPFYRTIQFSSYDRSSDQPDGPGWYANSDGFGKEPIPNFEEILEEPNEEGVGTYLLCDIEGPGAIVRGWTARMDGILKVYLDNSETPVYEGPARPFLQNTYNIFSEETDIDSEIYNNTFSQRDAGYFPMPYAEHLRIEWTGNIDNLHFYYLQVRVYEEATQVQTFQSEDIQIYKKEIEQAAKILNNPDQNYSASASGGKSENISADVKAGEKQQVFSAEGEAAIQFLELEVEADNLEKALRQTVLNISFDGAPHAQVQMPVGDYFGAAPGINPYVSLPFTVHADGKMVSRFFMPFKDSASVVIDNKGEQNVHVKGSVNFADYSWNDERSMHFRARWRVDHDMDENFPYDLPFIIAKGEGVYVGSTSILFNPLEIPTAGGNWWGEGDEKIFVDDDTFPSTFGTGSEDYYNYSWSSPDIFQTPYSGQPRNDGPANRGFVTNHRWHVVDPLPFKSDLHFYMELFPHTNVKGFSYARGSYFYARPRLKDDHIPVSYDDVRHLEHTYWTPEAAGGASNSVFYQVEEILNEKPRIETMEDNMWAEGRLLVWKPAQTGSELEIPFSVSEEGNYRVWITAALMNESGKFSARVNGEEAGFGGSEGIINLQIPHRKLLRNYGSSTILLNEGNHSLSIRYEGSENDTYNKIGLDFIWIQKR
ncbi:MAG: glycoside hydrolase family 172 protein [Balneolaceae bacterium]